MIIPVKCFTCGNVLANKYQYYLTETMKRKQVPKELQEKENSTILYFDDDHQDKSIEGEVLDELYLTKQCCRRHMLTHVDIF